MGHYAAWTDLLDDSVISSRPAEMIQYKNGLAFCGVAIGALERC